MQGEEGDPGEPGDEGPFGVDGDVGFEVGFEVTRYNYSLYDGYFNETFRGIKEQQVQKDHEGTQDLQYAISKTVFFFAQLVGKVYKACQL